MKKLCLFLFLSFFTVYCGKVSSLKITSTGSLEGKYEGSLGGIDYELWLEDVGKVKGDVMALMLFKKENANKVQQTLKKYQNLQSYISGVCEYIKSITKPSPYPELIALSDLWNKVGAYGHLSINDKNSDSVSISPIHYIYLPENDEYGIESIELNSKKELSKVKIFETGYLKSLVSYFYSPGIKLKKTSSSVGGLVKKYFEHYFGVLNHFEKKRGQQAEPCPSFT